MRESRVNLPAQESKLRPGEPLPLGALPPVKPRPERRWYRQPSSIIGVVTIAVSVGLSVLATRIQQSRTAEEERQDQYQSVVRMVDSLVSIQSQYASLISSPGSPDRLAQDLILNSRRQIIFDEIEALLASSDIENSLTANIFVILANENAQDSRFNRARDYFEQALEIAEDPATRVVVHRSLGNLHMIPSTPVRDLEKGRSHWRQALEVGALKADDYSKTFQVQTLHNWAMSEHFNGNSDEATDLVSRGFAVLKDLDPRMPLRDQWAQRLGSFGQWSNDESIVSLVDRLPGQWDVSWPDGAAFRGSALISALPNGGFGLSMDVIGEGGLLIQRMSGIAQPVSLTSVRVEWQALSHMPTGPQAGSMTLRVSTNPSELWKVRLEGQMHALGQAPVLVQFAKV